jgi:hypothetical protein
MTWIMWSNVDMILLWHDWILNVLVNHCCACCGSTGPRCAFWYFRWLKFNFSLKKVVFLLFWTSIFVQNIIEWAEKWFATKNCKMFTNLGFGNLLKTQTFLVHAISPKVFTGGFSSLAYLLIPSCRCAFWYFWWLEFNFS